MVTRISLAFAFLCRSAIWAADTVEPLNIKLGLWGTTRTLEMSGQPLMPPEAREAMAKMPPEQRAKAEEMMKEYANMAAKPTVHRDCLKKEDLDRPLIKLEDIGLISNLLIAITPGPGHSWHKCLRSVYASPARTKDASTTAASSKPNLDRPAGLCN
jgi:Protein of unknown function (DUF3617)